MKTDPATEAEVSQLRSVLGSAGWVARQCRMEYAYKYSELQSAVTRAKVQDLTEANELVAQLKKTSGTGLFFKSKCSVDFCYSIFCHLFLCLFLMKD